MIKESIYCFFCGQNVRLNDDFCYGCNKYVCKECDENELIEIGHKTEEHAIPNKIED
jgi:hypothetical protein